MLPSLKTLKIQSLRRINISSLVLSVNTAKKCNMVIIHEFTVPNDPHPSRGHRRHAIQLTLYGGLLIPVVTPSGLVERHIDLGSCTTLEHKSYHYLLNYKKGLI